MTYNPIEDPRVLSALPTAPATPTRAFLIEYGGDAGADVNPSPRVEDRPVVVAPDDPDEVLVTENKNTVPPPPGVTATRPSTVRSITVDPPAPRSVNRVPPPEGAVTTPTAATGQSRVYSFLVNPENIDYNFGQASYSEVTAHASTRSHLHYSHTTNETLKFDLLLDTWCEGKHLKPLLDGARALMEASVEKGIYEPPTMEFVMGARRSGPCKVVSVSGKETRWRNGFPAGVQLSFELKRIPFPSRSQNYLDLPAISDASGLAVAVELTDRQMEDARTAARLYLEDKLTEYAPSVQELVRGGTYSLTPGSDGVVEMKDDAGNVIGVVGQWDGRELRVTGVNTIPAAEPVEEKEAAADAEAADSGAEKAADPLSPGGSASPEDASEDA